MPCDAKPGLAVARGALPHQARSAQTQRHPECTGCLCPWNAKRRLAEPRPASGCLACPCGDKSKGRPETESPRPPLNTGTPDM